MPPKPLIGLDIFHFSSKTAERNWTKLEMKQDHNVLYQVSVFRAELKTKMAALASDWLRHFRLLLWNPWIELNKTSQEARTQIILQVCIFWTNLNVKSSSSLDSLRHLWFLFWNHWMEFNKAWQKARNQLPSPSLCFLGQSENQDGHPGGCVNKDGTLYSGARYVAFWVPCSSCTVNMTIFTERK